MREPYLQDDAFLQALERAEADASPDTLHAWWLGQSGFLIRWNGAGLLFDPYLSDSLTKKYAETDKPHVRMTKRVIAPERIASHVDVVTSSHNHTDHLDAETLLPLRQANPALKLVVPVANETFARERFGPETPDLLPVDAGQSVTSGPFTLHALHAAHNEVELDEQGRSKYLGYVATFGDFAVYHSGDTLWHADMVAEVRRWPIDLAFLPINGNKPERRVAGNLDGLQAAALAKAVSAKLVVPCHYHMFEFNTEESDEFEASCHRLDQPFRTLQNGEGLTIQR